MTISPGDVPGLSSNHPFPSYLKKEQSHSVQDTELKYTPKGAAVCSFALASNRYFKQDEETQKEVSYFDITTWSRLAEVCGEYLKKGRGVRVVGRLKQDRNGADAGDEKTEEVTTEETASIYQPGLPL